MNRLQRVDRSSFTFNTDITSSSANDTCNSGVIHAIKIKDFDDGDGGLLQHEENAIAWVEDANHASVNALIDQLISLDFEEDRMRFIPYSSKAAWSQRYPHASELHCFHYSSRCNANNQPAFDSDPSFMIYYLHFQFLMKNVNYWCNLVSIRHPLRRMAADKTALPRNPSKKRSTLQSSPRGT